MIDAFATAFDNALGRRRIITQDISADLSNFSFNDGRNTFTTANAEGTFFVSTDASGMLTGWQIHIDSPFPTTTGLNDEIDILFIPPGNTLNSVGDGATIYDCTQVALGKCVAFGESDSALNLRVAGTWSAVAVTPLPAALPLFATGLGILGLLGWRRKRKALAA